VKEEMACHVFFFFLFTSTREGTKTRRRDAAHISYKYYFSLELSYNFKLIHTLFPNYEVEKAIQLLFCLIFLRELNCKITPMLFVVLDSPHTACDDVQSAL